jgi:ketosteroid isomerase-like protein
MSVRSRLVGGTLALVVVLGASQAQPAELTAQEAAAVRKLFDDTVRYVRANNWTAWAGQWSEDGLFQPPNAAAVKGRAAILAWGKAFPPIEALAFSNVQVWGEGNLAYGASAYAMTIKGSPPDSGKQLVVFRRSAGGKWEVVAASFNSDLPVPGQTQAGAPKK